MKGERIFKENCRRYIEIGTITTPLEKEKKALKKSIDEFTEGHAVSIGGYSVNYADIRGQIDIDALLADHPEIDIEKYRKPSTTRISVKAVEA